MIATGIGINACNEGKQVLFVNAKEFVDKLYEEMTVERLADTLEKLQKIDLLIIDELSYIKMDRERESLFFQIIRQRYEKSSLIITTNLPMGRWDELFTGQLAATAILDRLLHHCHVLSITGDSYRVKGSKLNVKNGYISLEQAAEYLNIKPVTLRKWIRNRDDIPAHQIGKLWKFKKAELDEWINSGRSAQSAIDEKIPPNNK